MKDITIHKLYILRPLLDHEKNYNDVCYNYNQFTTSAVHSIQHSHNPYLPSCQTPNNHIEYQYYNPSSRVKRGRIVTEDICAICYNRRGIVQADEIRNKRDIGGKNLLLDCQYYFDKNFEIPCSGGRVNMKQKKVQE